MRCDGFLQDDVPGMRRQGEGAEVVFRNGSGRRAHLFSCFWGISAIHWAMSGSPVTLPACCRTLPSKKEIRRALRVKRSFPGQVSPKFSLEVLP
jgi:hypothetical protein